LGLNILNSNDLPSHLGGPFHIIQGLFDSILHTFVGIVVQNNST